MKIIIGKFLLLLAAIFWCSFACASTYPQRLDQILKKYKLLPQSADVRRLVELDQELTTLVEEIQKNDQEGKSASVWKKEYEEIGVYVGHYSEQIGYSGKLLVEAHEANPNSPYRKYTLYTTIVGEGSSHGLGEMPDIKQAYQYLHEYPQGPYAENTYAILGSFYDDLSKVLAALVENATDKEDYKYDCFSSYVTKEPYEAQLRKARFLAIENLKKATSFYPKSEKSKRLRQELEDVRRGTSIGWHWCAD